MKKITIVIAVLALFLTNCKNDKKEVKPMESESSITYSVIPETSVIKWIAYKTTDKVPVKGKFNAIKIRNPKEASSVKDALNGIEFAIPISSIFTNDSIRDNKLKQFFFGAMKNTEIISGTFDFNDKGQFVNITMNGITKSLPIELTIDGQTITFSNTLNLKDWELTDAIASLNKACDVLHKGPDGISKTWDEVNIKAVIYLRANSNLK